MNPVTHFLAGWLLANAAPLECKERALVTLAGVIPDLDGLGIVAEVLTKELLPAAYLVVRLPPCAGTQSRGFLSWRPSSAWYWQDNVGKQPAWLLSVFICIWSATSSALGDRKASNGRYRTC